MQASFLSPGSRAFSYAHYASRQHHSDIAIEEIPGMPCTLVPDSNMTKPNPRTQPTILNGKAITLHQNNFIRDKLSFLSGITTHTDLCTVQKLSTLYMRRGACITICAFQAPFIALNVGSSVSSNNDENGMRATSLRFSRLEPYCLVR